MPPEAQLRLGSCDLLALGTIPGFVPDGERVDAAFRTHAPTVVALGIPPEDLQALAALHAEPGQAQELPEADPLDQRLAELLAPFGATKIPSPDLEQAYAMATASGTPLEAIDLDDEAHTRAYTTAVKVRHLMQARSRRKKAAKRLVPGATAYEVAAAWEAGLLVAPTRQIEADRERHMAQRLADLASRHARILVVVHANRLPGILAHLQG